MTDNDIIKALKEILEIMLTMGDLQKSGTISKTLDLINRQKAEIEEKNKHIMELQGINEGLEYVEADNEFYDTVANWCKAISNNLAKGTVGDNNG